MHWPAKLGVQVQISRRQKISQMKQGSIEHSLPLSLSHHLYTTELLLKSKGESVYRYTGILRYEQIKYCIAVQF